MLTRQESSDKAQNPSVEVKVAKVVANKAEGAAAKVGVTVPVAKMGLVNSVTAYQMKTSGRKSWRYWNRIWLKLNTADMAILFWSTRK
jgi:hypothetical protein